MSDFAKDTNVPTNDCISRKAAIDAIIAEGRTVDSRYLESERIIHESDAVEAISMLPSAEPKKGRWDLHKSGALFICSACGETSLRTERYCPNCGARMEVTE